MDIVAEIKKYILKHLVLKHLGRSRMNLKLLVGHGIIAWCINIYEKERKIKSMFQEESADYRKYQMNAYVLL